MQTNSDLIFKILIFDLKLESSRFDHLFGMPENLKGCNCSQKRKALSLFNLQIQDTTRQLSKYYYLVCFSADQWFSILKINLHQGHPRQNQCHHCSYHQLRLLLRQLLLPLQAIHRQRICFHILLWRYP